MTNNVDVSGGILNNAGEMTAQITMNAGADSSLVNNTGTINKIVQNAGVFNNSGSVTGRMMSAGGVFNNQTDGAIMRGAALTGTAVANNEGTRTSEVVVRVTTPGCWKLIIIQLSITAASLFLITTRMLCTSTSPVRFIIPVT